jgi:transcription factor E
MAEKKTKKKITRKKATEEKSRLNQTKTQNNSLKKILKEVVTLIAGKQAEDIVDLLDTKKHINEFVTAKKLDLTINQTRNILYKISDHGLVSYIRKKDKKKGWYTYFWKIEILKSLEFMKNDLLKKIDQLEHKIKSRETKRFYICERCNLELSEENALLYNFTCNECGDILALKDNTKFVREMKKSLEKLKKDLVFLEEEMKKEIEKVEKIKLKERRKEEKLKAKKRPKRKKSVKKKPVKKKIIRTIKKKPVKKTKKRLKPKPKIKKKSIKRPKTQKIKKPKKKIKKKPRR